MSNYCTRSIGSGLSTSKMKQRLLAILKQEGFITDYSHNEKGPQGTLEVVLKYMPSRKGVTSPTFAAR